MKGFAYYHNFPMFPMVAMPYLRGFQPSRNAMSLENQNPDVIEICDLEYDVASVGSVESSASEENQAAFHLVFYRLPENG